MIIDFLTTGDFSLILTRVYVILAMWAIMCIAVCVDLWAGVNSAKARGEKVYSGGLRRTFASQVAKLPDAIRAIIQCADAKTAEQLLEKLKEVTDDNKQVF